MSSVTICGYEIVRRAETSCDPEGRGAYPSSVPRIGTKLYHGLDRMPWFDLDELWYLNAASPELGEFRRRLREENDDWSGIYLVDTLFEVRQAKDALDKARPAVAEHNEIVALYSPTLEKLKSRASCERSSIAFLGLDVVGIGEWSLIREGLFGATALQAEWAKALNEWGLFESQQDCAEFADAYRAASRQLNVEELGRETRVESIAVYRVVGDCFR